jgi:hypothetical protein
VKLKEDLRAGIYYIYVELTLNSIINYLGSSLCNNAIREYNKIEIFKMADSRSVEVSDKEISEIKMNSDQKTQKDLCKNTKTIIREISTRVEIGKTRNCVEIVVKTDLHITHKKTIIILDYFTYTACRASDN